MYKFVIVKWRIGAVRVPKAPRALSLPMALSRPIVARRAAPSDTRTRVRTNLRVVALIGVSVIVSV